MGKYPLDQRNAEVWQQEGRYPCTELRGNEKALQLRNLSYAHICDDQNQLSALGELIVAYFAYRAEVINTFIEPNLMEVERASTVFEETRLRLNSTLVVPMNKQSGEKKAPAYFTGIINMLIQESIGNLECNYNPQQLTTITRHGRPYRTLARCVDGAFPSTVNPIAVWEIKEYYYTTTFGSRIADGKPYLCRIVDILHMGYVDHVLFGYEVVDALPGIVQGWVETYRERLTSTN